MHYVYIVECADGTYYTGYTVNIKRRIQQHNKGQGAKYTRGRLPVKLLYYEKYNTRSKAMKREYAVKQLKKQEKQKLIKLKKSKGE
ncbi:MAG: GIY-YIG nuclease family protein [Halanaerobiales bacterium]